MEQFFSTNSKKCFFSYKNKKNTFQTGYLGIGPSKIFGGFHIRCATFSHIKISEIKATLIGRETVKLIVHDGLNKLIQKENTFYSQTHLIYKSVSTQYAAINKLDLEFEFELKDDLPPSNQSECNMPFAQDTVDYYIIITIFRKTSKFHPNEKKIISTKCNIERYSIPSDIKSVNSSGMLMDRIDLNENLTNEILIDAFILSKFIDMNSHIIIPIGFTQRNSYTKLKEINVLFEEFQSFTVTKYDSKNIQYKFTKPIFDQKFLFENMNIKNIQNNIYGTEYSFEIELIIPAFDCKSKTCHAFEGVRNMKFFNVRHVLKIFYKFEIKENLKTIVLQKDIWLQRTLSEKEMLIGIENGQVNRNYLIPDKC
jgi:hypothetical protein